MNQQEFVQILEKIARPCACSKDLTWLVSMSQCNFVLLSHKHEIAALVYFKSKVKIETQGLKEYNKLAEADCSGFQNRCCCIACSIKRDDNT